MAQIANVCPMCGGSGFLFFKDMEPDHIALRRYSKAREAWTAYHNAPEDERAVYLWQGYCLYCKGVHTPSAGQENREKHAQAMELRNKFEFSSAISIYGDILNEDSNDHKAHWLRALSTHEIADVSGSLFFFSAPHTHGPLCEDDDYRAACEKARLLSTYDALRYQEEAERLDRIRAEYLEINKRGTPCKICVITSPDAVGQAQTFADYLREKRDDLNLFVADATKADREAASCYASNTAGVMILMGNVGTFTDESLQYRFWKPFTLRANTHLVALTSQSLPEELDRFAARVPTGDGWKQRLFEMIERIYPPTQTVVQETTIIQETYVQGDLPIPELINGAFQAFRQHDFRQAAQAANKVLQAGQGDAPSYYISAFYHSFVENTHNRDAVKNFFAKHGNSRLSAENAAKMRSLFLISGSRLIPYEETAVRMILNADGDKSEQYKFADVFCSRLVAKQKDRGFLLKVKDLYCTVARNQGAEKLCEALLASTATNPDSPIAGKCFHLKTKARLFREEYFLPIGEIIRSIPDDSVRQRLLQDYTQKLESYDAKL